MAQEVLALKKTPAVPRAGVPESGLATLGQDIQDAVEGTSAAVTTTAEAVQGTAQGAATAVNEALGGVESAVGATVKSAGEMVSETVRSLQRVLDVPAHLRRHPWLMVGGAVLLGVMLGRLSGRRR